MNANEQRVSSMTFARFRVQYWTRGRRVLRRWNGKWIVSHDERTTCAINHLSRPLFYGKHLLLINQDKFNFNRRIHESQPLFLFALHGFLVMQLENIRWTLHGSSLNWTKTMMNRCVSSSSEYRWIVSLRARTRCLRSEPSVCWHLHWHHCYAWE